MIILSTFALALAGGFGALSRYMLTIALGGYASKHVAVATLCINVLASFAIGILAVLAMKTLVSPEWKMIIGTGFLGGFSTFSTMMNENLAIAKHARYSVAINLIVQCALPIIAVMLGMALARGVM